MEKYGNDGVGTDDDDDIDDDNHDGDDNSCKGESIGEGFNFATEIYCLDILAISLLQKITAKL